MLPNALMAVASAAKLAEGWCDMPTMMDLDKERVGRRQRAAKADEDNPTLFSRLFGKKREESRMGSDKNIDKERIGKGGFQAPQTQKAPTKTTPKAPRKTSMGPSVTSKPAGEPVAPSSPTSAQTAGIAGLAGGPSGASVERTPEEGKTSYFGEAEQIVNQETPRMLKGLFGEDIPEDTYKEMERKNKEAGFYGRFKKGGQVKKAKKYASGGSVSSASKRGDGCATKGKTRGRMV